MNAVLEELQRLKREGVGEVFVSDEALGRLRALAGERVGGSAAVGEPAKPAPARPATRPARGAVSEKLSAMLESDTPKRKSGPAPAAKPASPAPAGIAPLPDPPVVELPSGSPEEQMIWLRERVENCPVCREHVREGCKVVFGTGAVDADIFFCGEAPGADEERAGEPFVGKAGQLLTKIIEAMGLTREGVYIGNILKWRPEHERPTGNRPPTPAEMAFCMPYLKAQLEIIRPKVVIALGNTAVTGLLGPDPDRRMGRIRGKWHAFNSTPLMVTFHPSYLLRNQALETKRLVWEDMLAVMEKVGLPVSEKQRGYFLKG